jgi:thiosulfate/3-mercaptopyruvate sulfurtransferase
MSFKTLIDARQLEELLAAAEPHLAILDCRFDLANPRAGHQAYLDGHIPGAHFADLNQDLSAPIGPKTGRHPLPDPLALAASMASWGIHPEGIHPEGIHPPRSQVVVYDEANGSFAARAWWLLRWLGHDAVAVLDGGFKAWVAAGGPTSRGEEGRTPVGLHDAPAAAAVNDELLVDAARVEALLRDPQHLLVDARAAERFAGAVEPIDSVAGHIAGAVNHPFTQNLGPDGRFLPAEQLREHWLSELDGRSPVNVVAMCGSGVTACHNLLSLEIAGLAGAKLYAGSWSEWIRDPKRPIARHSGRQDDKPHI